MLAITVPPDNKKCTIEQVSSCYLLTCTLKHIWTNRRPDSASDPSYHSVADHRSPSPLPYVMVDGKGFELSALNQ